jgi:hypothetical protein
MHKRYLHHLWTVIRPIKTGYFLVAFIMTAAMCVLALRSNYQHMAELRTAVYVADEQNTNVESALQALRAYVNGHMNTSLTKGAGSVYPPIHLLHTYERLKKIEQERVNAVNSQVYTEAQRSCEQQYPGSFSGGPRVPCIEAYVKSHGTTARPIPQDLYKFSFASPSWSPDFAGWTLALSILLLVLTILRFLAGRLLKALSK